LVAKLHGLPVSRLQYQHGFFADGRTSAGALGQSADDAAIDHLSDGARIASRARGKYFVNTAHCSLLTAYYSPPTAFHIKGDSVGEKEITDRASGHTRYVCACDRQARTSDQDAHKDQIACYGNSAIRYVELQQPAQRLSCVGGGPILPRPTLMPNKIIQHRQLNCRGGRRQITHGKGAVRKNKKCAGLQSKPEHANHIEPDEVNH